MPHSFVSVPLATGPVIAYVEDLVGLKSWTHVSQDPRTNESLTGPEHWVWAPVCDPPGCLL